MALTTQEVDPSTYEQLSTLIESGKAKVGVIGLGYVGLPLCHTLHGGGLSVVGFDTDHSKVEMLEEGESYLKHLGAEVAQSLGESKRFSPTTDFSRLSECDVIIVCVPTPLGQHREPDLSYVLSTATKIGRSLRRGQLICLESTTYPRTTRDEFLPAIVDSARTAGAKLDVGTDFFVAFSPEREDPGSASHNTQTIPKLVGGLDPRSTALAVSLYSKGVAEVVEVSSAEIAEAAKLLENIFRSVNIALVNEMKVILDAMDIDVWEVIRAASTKPFGYMPFYPGPGLGGHCIPIDPFYLTWKAKEVGHPTKFIELAGEINTEMPSWVVHRVLLGLNDSGKAVKGSRILVLGLAYKPNVDDSRESPAFELIEKLEELGAEVDYSDPHIPIAPRVRKHDIRKESVELTAEALASYDCVLIATNHRGFDYELIAGNAPLIVDTRDAFFGFEGRIKGKLYKA